MRLIDADELIKKLDEQIQMPTFMDCLSAINTAPTIEPKRGEWIDQDKGALYPIECSACHTPPPCDEEDYFLTNFCPNCGADMREVRDE